MATTSMVVDQKQPSFLNKKKDLLKKDAFQKCYINVVKSVKLRHVNLPK